MRRKILGLNIVLENKREQWFVCSHPRQMMLPKTRTFSMIVAFMNFLYGRFTYFHRGPSQLFVVNLVKDLIKCVLEAMFNVQVSQSFKCFPNG
jgi:hypothetical protein